MTKPAVTTYARSAPRCAIGPRPSAAAPMSTDGSRLHSAASSAVLPRTDWRYWVVKYAEPIIPKADRVLRTSAGVKTVPAEQGGRDHRRGRGALAVHEQGREQQADGDRDDVADVPPLGGQLLEAVDHGQDRRHRQRDAQQVEAAGGGVPGLREQHRTEDQQQGHRGQVHQEDRAPPEVLHEDAAHHRAERDPGRHHPGPQPDRLRPLGGVGEHRAASAIVDGIRVAPPMPRTARAAIRVSALCA
ncbi:hypothetical protein STENM327S_03813 [Streptomyces tendae]